jgi:hypothetical protein
MKYPKLTVLRWTDKALSKRRLDRDNADRSKTERLIVLTKNESLLYDVKQKEVIDFIMHAHDSYVVPAKESVPTNLKVSQRLFNTHLQFNKLRLTELCKKFSIKIVPAGKGKFDNPHYPF